MRVYFNPLDVACKNIIGGVKEKDLIQLNIFYINSEGKSNTQARITNSFCENAPNLATCSLPNENAYLRLFRDGENPELFAMQKTEFGWCMKSFPKE